VCIKIKMLWWNPACPVDGLLGHEQIRFLAREALRFSACKFRHGGSATGILKGMGDETLIGLLHVTPKTHPLLIKRIGTTILDHAPGTLTIFPIVKLAKVDSDTP